MATQSNEFGGFKPLLAATVKDPKTLTYPLLASPKLDGIRAVFLGGRFVSRSLKDIPNAHVQSTFQALNSKGPGLEGLDGELIVGPPTAPDAFRATSSAVMSSGGSPDAVFYVFDGLVGANGAETGFDVRLAAASRRVKALRSDRLVMVPHVLVECADQLIETESKWLELGFEGVMLRQPDGKYKYGRSTAKEGHLMKVKQFSDSEAEIIGFEQLMHNANEAKRNALGHLERSSHKAGKVGAGMLGAFKVRDKTTGVEFDIGTGFTEKERKLIWYQRKSVVGRLVKYKYFPSGSKDKPRFPVFLGFRDPIDLGE